MDRHSILIGISLTACAALACQVQITAWSALGTLPTQRMLASSMPVPDATGSRASLVLPSRLVPGLSSRERASPLPAAARIRLTPGMGWG
ncbi:MAG TPA: hypothetical protein VME92_05890 [Acetobacteraceae bacterium]|nr:hypothetical protein [Acetobacteraceae bacterium]